VKKDRSRIIALSCITVFLVFIYYKNFGDKEKGALDTTGIAGFIRTHDRLASEPTGIQTHERLTASPRWRTARVFIQSTIIEFREE